MRCANHACEAAVRKMEDYAREVVPNGQTSEDDIWAVLHAENIRRGEAGEPFLHLVDRQAGY